MPKSFHFSMVCKGVLLAGGITLVLSLLLGILFTFTPLQESDLTYYLIIGVSVLIAAIIISYQAGMKGLIYGLSIGLGFLLLLLLLSAIISPASPSWLSVGEKAIIALTAGGIGGIIGVLVRR